MKLKQKIYLINQVDTSLYKIGVSNRPDYRRRTLQTGSPYKLKLFGEWECEVESAVEAERALHKKLSRFKTHGEWFDLTEGVLNWLLRFLGEGNLYPLWEPAPVQIRCRESRCLKEKNHRGPHYAGPGDWWQTSQEKKEFLIVVCKECETKNRVPLDRINERPICGKCKSRL